MRMLSEEDALRRCRREERKLKRRIEDLERALQRVVDWDVPKTTGRFWDDGKPMSYAAAYGLMGERDFIRRLAGNALKKP